MENSIHLIINIDEKDIDEQSRLNTIKYFIESGVPVNHQDKYLNTPLHLAVKKQLRSVCKLLLDNGGDPSITNSFGKNALHLAANSTIVPCEKNKLVGEIVPKPKYEEDDTDFSDITKDIAKYILKELRGDFKQNV